MRTIEVWTSRALGALLALLACACGGAQPTPSGSPEEPVDEPIPAVTIALRYVDAEVETDASAVPMTRIVLVDIDSVRGRRTTDLGNYPGACSPVALASDVLVAARCFWLGVSADVTVRKVGDSLVATRTDSADGQAPTAAREVVRVDLLPHARVEVLSAPPSRALAP